MEEKGNNSKITLGISSCLLGQEVRFDSSHKHNRYITDSLGEYFQFQAFCPEVAIGLGIPRPAIRLVKVSNDVRVRGVKDPEQDVTDAIKDYSRQAAKLCTELSGYIFKSKSPSCGMERVKIYSEKGDPLDNGPGLYAQGIMQQYPFLPVEEEGRLMDAHLRENFIERVFVYHRWQQYQNTLTPASLVEFHSRHKFTVLAHDEKVYRELGRLVADAGKADLKQLGKNYMSLLMTAMNQLATTKSHTNVLQHIMGFFKDKLSSEDKQELLSVLDDYRLGKLPLIVPVTLIKHYLRLYPDDYIASQYYLNPHPKELMLRNRI
ncbi:MAG: DUF1722 domain-containing protein [Gammaproteobacteria bacterium]|nr:DUF1722 domain-containing protein [Gammaproteobacteria bacterium]